MLAVNKSLLLLKGIEVGEHELPPGCVGDQAMARRSS